MSLAVVRSSTTLGVAATAKVTFPSAPTVGNLIIACFYFNGVAPTIDTAKWTQFGNTGGSTGNYAVYRYVQSGDLATLPAITTNTSTSRVLAAEISGVAGLFATDFEQIVYATNISGLSLTTTRSSDLAFTYGGHVTGGSIWTPGTGWTLDQSNTTEASVLEHKSVPTLGTTITDNGTWNLGTNSGLWMMFTLSTGATGVTGSGSIGTITLSSVASIGAIKSGGLIGTITLTPPSATSVIVGQGLPGSVSITAPTAITSIVGQGPLSTITIRPPSTLLILVDQFGSAVPAVGDVSIQVDQFGSDTIAVPSVNARVSQLGTIVIAAGTPAPPAPDPLNLTDKGRKPVLKQRLVNVYVEPTPQGPGRNARYQRPGLYSAAVRGDGPIKKSFLWNGYRITISGGQVWRDAINVGTIPSKGRVRYAFSEDELVIIAGGQAYLASIDDVQVISSDVLPTTLIDVVFLSGRFVYVDGKTAQFWWSELNDAKNVDDLSFATVNENSADFVVGATVLVDNIVFFTHTAIDWWYPAGDPDAPFQRSPGRKNDRGLAAQDSLVLCDNALFFIGDNRIVYKTGQVPLRVSDFDIEDHLRRVDQDDLPDCSAFSLVFGGHTFYVMHLIGRGTWAYDISMKSWAEWKSFSYSLFRVACCDESGVAGDRYSGNLMAFDGGQFTDMGDPIERVISAFLPVKSGSAGNFNLALDCTRGVGLPDGYGSEPVVEMRYSENEGRTWTDWISAPLGAMGDATDRSKAIWYQLGSIRAPGRLFEFRCTDPVYFAPYNLRYNEQRP